LSFEIFEGNQVFVDRVILSGLEVTREEALRQAVAILPQEPLSTEGLLETRQRLVGTGLFNDVSVEALPLDPSNQSSDVLIRLEEGPRTTFGYGFGYNEVDLARVEAEITRRNLFGRNRTASVFGRASVKGGRFVLSYRQPNFFSFNVPTFATAFFEEGERKSFDFIQKGVGVHFTKRQSEKRTYFFRYNYKQTRTLRLEVPPDELPREFRNNRLSIVSVSQVTDTRDDVITPSRGQFRLLDFEVSAKVIGSESSFLKGLAQQFFYFPLPKQMVGVIGFRFGVARRHDVDVVIPITERFFAGGANTLRGFGLDLASPKDAEGNPVGGNVLTLLNLELRFPIVGNLRGVFFSDNGTVYRRLSTPPGPWKIFDPRNWRSNLGFGFRYQTPLGPLRVDMGFKLDRRMTTSEEGLVLEPLSRVHVSLGHAF
jgi:outer membrane protein assembly complex protein YaeT